MKLKELERLLDPSQHRYTKELADPYRISPHRSLTIGTEPLHLEIIRLLCAEEAVDPVELAHFYFVDQATAERAIAYALGYIAANDQKRSDELAVEVRDRLRTGAPIMSVALARQFSMSRENTVRVIVQQEQQFAVLKNRRELMAELIRKVAKRRKYFTADHIKLGAVTDIDDPVARTAAASTFGPCIKAAEKEGICEKTKRRAISKRISQRGARKLTVWRSLLWGGGKKV